MYTRYLKSKTPNGKTNKPKNYFERKISCEVPLQEYIKRGYAIQMTYFICYLIYWKEFKQHTTIHTSGIFTMCCCDGRQIEDTRVWEVFPFTHPQGAFIMPAPAAFTWSIRYLRPELHPSQCLLCHSWINVF